MASSSDRRNRSISFGIVVIKPRLKLLHPPQFLTKVYLGFVD
uniref:Uncharacterized protein n=1 Tax=Heterorhabditis bacteriophora TaxID=37862 RepID=A0A1I7WEQ1_HETBA